MPVLRPCHAKIRRLNYVGGLGLRTRCHQYDSPTSSRRSACCSVCRNWARQCGCSATGSGQCRRRGRLPFSRLFSERSPTRFCTTASDQLGFPRWPVFRINIWRPNSTTGSVRDVLIPSGCRKCDGDLDGAILSNQLVLHVIVPQSSFREVLQQVRIDNLPKRQCTA